MSSTRQTSLSGEMDISAILRTHMVAERYQVVAVLGRGGFATVYRAWDRQLAREVALKVIVPGEGHDRPVIDVAHALLASDPVLPRTPVADDHARIEALKEEFRRLSQVHHPGIAHVYDFGHCSVTGVVYLGQELVDGQGLRSFASHVARTCTANGDAANHLRSHLIQIFLQLLHALDCLHTVGLVHGDIKPSNILVQLDAPPNGRPFAKLIDFGLARQMRARYVSSHLPFARSTDETQEIAGTPGYCAPEWIRGEAVDGRADLYSLAATFYAVLSGERPVHGDTLAQALAQQEQWDERRSQEITRVGGPVLGELMSRMLDPDPNRRPTSARLVALELARKQADLGLVMDNGLLADFALFLADTLPFVDRGGYRQLLLTRAFDILPSAKSQHADGKHLIRTVVIEAAEGLGKQRLIHEVSRELMLAGHRFVQVSCWSNERDALGPFASLIVQLRRFFPAQLDAAQARRLAPFAELLAAAHGDTQSCEITDDKVATFVACVAQHAPFFLYIADLDRAPDQLHRIAQLCVTVASEGAPLCLCLGTQAHSAVSERLQRLARAQLLEYWRLRPFSHHEAIEVLTGTLGEPAIAREVAVVLEDLTGGHPLYFREALRLFIERGVLVREAGRWELRRHLLAQRRVTAPLVGRCIERLDRIGEHAWSLAVCLYLLDAPSDSETLIALTQHSSATTSTLLDRLEGEGLVSRQQYATLTRFALAHAAARQAVEQRYAERLNRERLLLATTIAAHPPHAVHLDFARARLIDDASQGLENLDVIEEIAQRLLLGGQPHRFAELMERVLNRLRRHGGLDQAPRLLRVHLDIITHAPGALVDQERELELLQDAILLGELLGQPQAQASAWLRRAELALIQGKGRERALQWLMAAEGAAATVDRNGGPGLATQSVAIRRAQLALACGSFHEAVEHAQAAYDQTLTAHVRKSGRQPSLQERSTSNGNGWATHDLGQEWLAPNRGPIEGDVCSAAAILLATLVVTGDFAGAAKHHRENREHIAAAALIPRISYLAQLGLWHALDRHAPDLDGWLAAGEVEIRAAALTRLLPTVLAARGEAALARQDLRAAELAWSESLSLAQRFGQSGLALQCRSRLAVALGRRGALSEANALTQEALVQLDVCHGDEAVRNLVRISAAEVAHLQGQSARAWRNLEELGASLRLAGAHGLAGLAEDLLQTIRSDRATQPSTRGAAVGRDESNSSLRLPDTDRPTQPTHFHRREVR